jgi:hypothetical protein
MGGDNRKASQHRVARNVLELKGVLRRIHLQHEHRLKWSDTVKTFHKVHTVWLAAAASGIMIAGAAGIAAADNATTAPSSGQATQQQTGAAAAPASTPSATPTTQPAKKKERIRRAERGTKGKKK